MKNNLRLAVEQSLVDIVLQGTQPSHIVTAVKLPTGAVEIAVNTEHTGEKLQYIVNAYDNHMRLKTNTDIQMLNVMVVFP